MPENARELSLTQSEDGSDRIAFAAPDFLNTRMIDQSQLVPELNLDGDTVTLQREGDNWTGSMIVPEGSDFQISLSWSERFRGRMLMLASFETVVESINSNQSIMLTNDDYTIDFDDDFDTVSNLAERRTSSDPFDSRSPDVDFALARLPAISPADAPVIDGSYEGIWNSATYVDVNRQNLSINNLMIDMGATFADGEPDYRWGGMHDGEFLYLVAFGEGGGVQTPFADSEGLFNDDTLNVFWDADNSANRQYDGVNDFHLLIPLLESGDDRVPNKSINENSRFANGSNSTFFPNDAIDFATCVCRRENNFWEMRIRLADSGIVVGQTFGFEIQLDDDRDGGDRDVKWGWQHPSRINEDRDFTWFDPSFMGTAVLESDN